MKMRNSLLAVLAAGLWINVSEFLRNEAWLKPIWAEHYSAMGLVFPSAPVNGAVWGVWGFIFAAVIFALLRRFSLAETIALAWVAGFVLMWLVVGNMGVLPFAILWAAVPLSLVEVAVAAWIIRRLAPA
jgi:hypothetical protein